MDLQATTARGCANCSGSLLVVPDRTGTRGAKGRRHILFFRGVRTFPLIGLIGYATALISGPQMLPLAIGFLVVAGFLLVSYWHKISTSETAGVTTEMSGLATFLVGALVCYGTYGLLPHWASPVCCCSI